MRWLRPSLQSGSPGRGPLASALRRSSTKPRSGQEAADDLAYLEGPLKPYGTRLHQVLSVFRFFSFAMGAGLFFVPVASELPDLMLGLQVGLVGLYNIGRVVWPPNPAKRSPLIETALLTGDVLLGVGVVLLTGGLDSPFLIFSMAPILTAGLFMGVRSATIAAAFLALAVSGAHEAAAFGLSDFPRLLESNYLAFALLYSAGCLFVAGLPFLANLNWQRRMQALAMEEERQRLRREVHDDVAQTLAFLSLKIRGAEAGVSGKRGTLTGLDVREISRVVQRSYLAVRDYLDGAGDTAPIDTLETSLAAVTSEWSQNTGLHVELKVSGEEPGLPPIVKRHMLQIAREALANAGKHARPDLVTLELGCTPTEVELRIQDDGIGFPANNRGGHGLEIMKQRAAIIGASLTVSSAPGEGAEVAIVYSIEGQDRS